VEPGPDNRKYQRLAHIKNNHSLEIPLLVDIAMRRTHGANYGTPLAGFVKAYNIHSTGNERQDEALAQYLFLAEHNLPLSAVI
jgi:hypothetical protein